MEGIIMIEHISGNETSNCIIIKLTNVKLVKMFVQNSCSGSSDENNIDVIYVVIIDNRENLSSSDYLASSSRLSMKDLGTDVGADM